MLVLAVAVSAIIASAIIISAIVVIAGTRSVLAEQVWYSGVWNLTAEGKVSKGIVPSRGGRSSKDRLAWTKITQQR